MMSQERRNRRKIYLRVAMVLTVGLLACGSWWPQAQEPAPTTTPIVIRFGIDGQAAPVDDANPTPTHPPIIAAPMISTPLPAATPTSTLTPEPLPSPIQSVNTPLPPVLPTEPPPTSTPQGESGIYTGNLTDQIALQGPDASYTLPPGADQQEFKWEWHGLEMRPCQLQEGYGFEVRIWPAPDNPNVVGSVSPMGTIDVAEVQDMIAASCDPKSKTWRYTVTYLHKTPAVEIAGGWGHFLWDVAYIQIEPVYAPVMVSLPRDFFIPPSDRSPTRTPTPTATAYFYSEPADKPGGTIELLAPDGATFGADVGPMEFKWRWDGPILEGKCQPAERYGFEIRVWSQQPGYTPLGVMDVIQDQAKVGCDHEAKVFNFTVLDIKQAPGIKQTFIDERWDGHFQWDVTLVSLQPYVSPDWAPPSKPFDITLSQYAGPLDPLGEPLACGAFSSWIEAQAVFLASGGPGQDFHQIDRDGNGLACDELRK